MSRKVLETVLSHLKFHTLLTYICDGSEVEGCYMLCTCK